MITGLKAPMGAFSPCFIYNSVDLSMSRAGKISPVKHILLKLLFR